MRVLVMSGAAAAAPAATHDRSQVDVANIIPEGRQQRGSRVKGGAFHTPAQQAVLALEAVEEDKARKRRKGLLRSASRRAKEKRLANEAKRRRGSPIPSHESQGKRAHFSQRDSSPEEEDADAGADAAAAASPDADDGDEEESEGKVKEETEDEEEEDEEDEGEDEEDADDDRGSVPTPFVSRLDSLVRGVVAHTQGDYRFSPTGRWVRGDKRPFPWALNLKEISPGVHGTGVAVEAGKPATKQATPAAKEPAPKSLVIPKGVDPKRAARKSIG